MNKQSAGSHDDGKGICLGGQKNGFDIHSLYSHAARLEKEKKNKGSHEGLARYIEDRWKGEISTGPQKTLFMTRQDNNPGGGSSGGDGGGGGSAWGASGRVQGRGPPGFEATLPPPQAGSGPSGADDFIPLMEDNSGNSNATLPPAKYVGWEGERPYCALCRAAGQTGGRKMVDLAAVFQHARSTAEESHGSNISVEKRKAHQEMCNALKSCLSQDEAKRTQALADDREIMQPGRRAWNDELYAGGLEDIWKRRLIIEPLEESCTAKDVSNFVLKTLLPGAPFMRTTQNVNDHNAVVAKPCIVHKDVTVAPAHQTSASAPEMKLKRVGAIQVPNHQLLQMIFKVVGDGGGVQWMQTEFGRRQGHGGMLSKEDNKHRTFRELILSYKLIKHRERNNLCSRSFNLCGAPFC